MRTAIAILIFATLAFGGAPLLRAAPKNLPPARVVAENSDVQVLRGGNVHITLKGIERNNNILRYEIISQPRHGRLEALEPADTNRQSSASITYVHNNDEASIDDSFSYRVTAPISKQNATGTVNIHIADLPPQLGAPTRLDFFAILGQSHSRSLSLTNIGGGTLDGEIRLSPPFSVSGSGTFHLPRNRSTNITVTFKPERITNDPPVQLQPSPLASPQTIISLTSRSAPPFAVNSPAPELHLNADGSRETYVTIENYASHPETFTVTITRPDLVTPPAPITLNPATSTNIALLIPSTHRSGEETFSATFSSPTHQESLHFSAPAVPPHLVILTPQLDFRNSYETVFNVENSGGTQGYFEISLPDGISTVEGARSFNIPPGSKASVHLLLGSVSGDEPCELLYRINTNAEPLHIPILLPDRSESLSPKNSSASKAVITPPSSTTAAAHSSLPISTPPSPTTPLTIINSERTRTSSTVRLSLPLNPNTTSFRIERLGIITPNTTATGIPALAEIVPVDHPAPVTIDSVEESQTDGHPISVLTISVQGLEPGTGSMWRIVPTSTISDTSPPPTREFYIRTLPPWRIPWRPIWLAAAFAALAAILYLRWLSRRPPK